MIARFLSAPFGSDAGLDPRLHGLLLILGCNPTTVVAQSEHELAGPSEEPLITHRAAEDKGLNLMLDYQALVEAEEKKKSPAAEGSFRAAQDVPNRVDWSKRVGKSWELAPVVADRRQAGQPKRPEDDRPPILRGDKSVEAGGFQMLREF